jgi:RHS repeat-associated protein
VGYALGTTGTGAGKLASITYPSGSVVNYGYDVNGRLASVTVNPVNANGIGANTASTMTVLSGVTYNAANQPTGWTWSSGPAYARSYDSFGRVASYQLGNPAGTGIAAGLTRTLAYDSAGQPITYTHTNSAGPQANFNHSYAYDGDSRVFGASIGNTWYGYDYDLNGNRTDRIIGSADYQSTYSTNSNKVVQEQTPQGPSTYGYDASGNVTFDGVVNYTYSDRGRMSSATIGANTVGYAYNGLEQRVSKSGSVIPSGAAYFVYDEAGKLLGEYDANGNPIYETIYAGVIPVGVMKQTGSAASNNLTVNLSNAYTDQLGTPRAITRQSDSAIVWRWDGAEAFGATAPDQNPSALGAFTFNQRFPGQVSDAETGNFHNWHRDYCPKCGRYIESDPIGLEGGPNTYNYSGNSPSNAIDPRGLDCSTADKKTSCQFPDPVNGPVFSVPSTPGFPSKLGPDSWLYHSYDVAVDLKGADPECVMKELRKHATPGSSNGASAEGTWNDATVGPFHNPVKSFTTRNLATGGQLVVNMTTKGGVFADGYVARGVVGDQVHTWGEGTSPWQSPYLTGFDTQYMANQIVWGAQMAEIVKKCECESQ